MGCDIHAHFEIKLNNKWEHYDQPNLQRNYKLFAKMANVRNDGAIKPISMPKGLPEDLSKIVRFCANYWKDDGHSWSWLDAKEIAEIYEFHCNEANDGKPEWKINHKEWGYLFGNGWGGFLEYPEDYPQEIQDIRLIFWFDN